MNEFPLDKFDFLHDAACAVWALIDVHPTIDQERPEMWLTQQTGIPRLRITRVCRGDSQMRLQDLVIVLSVLHGEMEMKIIGPIDKAAEM